MDRLTILDLIIGIVLILAIFIFFIAVAWKSRLLRDEITDPVSFLKFDNRTQQFHPFRTRKKWDVNRPFSLSRTQFAVWTAFIAAAYIYLYFIRFPGKAIAFDATVLALMGISMGTVTGGSVIDKSQSDKFRHQNHPSQGFWRDILSDENGVSIGRFQQVVWTTIALAVFVYKLATIQTAQFPQLDPSLLFLSGLSNAAYLTLKAGENSGDSAKSAFVNGLLDNDSSVARPPTPASTPGQGKQQQPV